jgi:hypothetical protein
MKKTLYSILALLLFCSTAIATDYYVDTTCDDNNVGSATVDGTGYDPTGPSCTGGSDSYYVSIADLNAKSFSAGDNIYLRKGQAWTGVEWTMNDSGSYGSPITIDAFGTGANPIIDGDDTANSCLDLGGADWVDIKNIRTTQGNGTNFRMAGGNDNINITNVTTDNCLNAHGFYYVGDNLLITGCTVYNNGAGGSDHGIYIDNDANLTTNVTIEHSLFYNNDDEIKINSGGHASRQTGIVIRYNIIKPNGNGRAILDSSSDGTQIYGNIIYENDSGHQSQAMMFNQDTLSLPAINTKIYNNVIHHAASGYWAIQFGGSGNDGADIRNNIFLSESGTGGYIRSNSGATFTACDHNQFYGGTANWTYLGVADTSLENWRSGTDWGDNSQVGDPKFTNSGSNIYTLESDSPCIDEGDTLGSPYDEDYLGVSRPVGTYYDIGAYEYGSSTPTTTTISSVNINTTP